MKKIGEKVTRTTAEKKETKSLETDMKNHKRKLPKFNKTKTVK